MKFSVVIVNYNVKYYLEQCLCSLYRAIDNISAEIFVVDNASVDDSEAYLTERFPRITYIYNKENVGFARANNQAIRQAKGEYVLLLNPDTVLPEQTLEEALLFMDTHPCVGAAGVKMLTDVFCGNQSVDILVWQPLLVNCPAWENFSPVLKV